MRLPIRARIALFGAVVVCATLVLFSVVLYLIALVGGRQNVDQELRDGTPTKTFQAVAAPDGHLQVRREGGFGPVPAQLPVPVHPGLATIMAGRNDRVRVRIQAEPDGTFLVTGEHLSDLESRTSGLLTYLFFTAGVTMVAGVGATWLAAGRALRPLKVMAAIAAEVGQTRDLRRRLPAVRPQDDELGRLTEAFNGMLSRLEIAQDGQRRFVADASHELRTPLTSIRGNAGLLLRDPAPDANDAREAVVDIATESERMSRLVDGLLTLARADAGLELQRTRLDLASVVVPVARRAGLASSVEPAPVLGDYDSLTQLAWILADNAHRHGGGQATMWVRPRSEGGAHLIVGDQGPGIPLGEEERIFERFYQADAARSNGGTGLGLAIARWIVQQHGGRIWAGNAPGGGAVFTVEIGGDWTTSPGNRPSSGPPTGPSPGDWFTCGTIAGHSNRLIHRTRSAA